MTIIFTKCRQEITTIRYLIMINNPIFINKVTTLPTIRLRDYDVVYAEADICLKIRKTPHKIYRYKKAN